MQGDGEHSSSFCKAIKFPTPATISDLATRLATGASEWSRRRSDVFVRSPLVVVKRHWLCVSPVERRVVYFALPPAEAESVRDPQPMG